MPDDATIITMGLGGVILGHAIHEGLPAIVFTPAPEPGLPGTDATGAIPQDRLSPGAVCIRFVNIAGALSVLDRLKMMMENFEHHRATAGGEPSP